MKLLFVIVSIIAIFSVDCRDFPKGYEDLASVGEAQPIPGEPNIPEEGTKPGDTEEDGKVKDNVIQVPLDDDSNTTDQQLNKPALTKSVIGDSSMQQVEDQQENNLRRVGCKARNACVVMAGYCVTNATLCGGRLVPEGCKGINCQCCVPGTLENKIREVEQDLKTMKENLTASNSRLNVEFQTRMNNLTDTNSRLSMEFQSRMENLTDSIYSMGSKLDSLLRRCPVGFFHTAGSNQCYKSYNDTKRSYTAAKEKCQTEGLVLAEPTNPISVRKFLVETYGQINDGYAYLGARGTGSYFRWERSGRQISNSDSLWLTGHPTNKVSNSNCLLMLVQNSTYLVSYPNQPYFATSCTYPRYTLCEYVIE